MDLSPDTILQRIPDLKIKIDSDNRLAITTADGVLECGPHGLAILDAFYEPQPVAGALGKLRARVVGAQDWIDLTSTIAQLYQAGVLYDVQQSRSVLNASDSSYDAAEIHVRMLDDRVRTSAFLKGIREVVRPSDVVVDIGTGTGVFAIAAAQAGARHVYAVEASGIANLARAAFEANGLADRITLIQGWSSQISLPERADVLISEMVGTDPMGDYVLEVMLDARKRLLKPDARMVPGRVKVFGLPVAIPRAELARHTFIDEAAQNWRSWYGIDFSPFVEAAERSEQFFSIKPQLAREWQTFGEPVLLDDIDLMAIKQLQLERTSTATATATGELNGLLVYFETEFGPLTRFSVHPAEVGDDSFRYNAVWILQEPLSLRAGDRFAVTFRYRVPGVASRVHVARL
ncbi:MAG: 50S ribosomal protein L11 methyltransferase [Kouleothrix sp.]|nr:50S ribosomal protein L11 methyltransferase [Kouleothrix sp.]